MSISIHSILSMARRKKKEDVEPCYLLNVLGERLKAARETAGFTQSALAQLLKVTQAAVSHIETGRSSPSPSVLASWLNMCGYDLEFRPRALAGNRIARLLAGEVVAVADAAEALSSEELVTLARFVQVLAAASPKRRETITAFMRFVVEDE